ncbi:HD-GYP domain-containing protein [Cyanobium sp. Morenito 9A2]|uniref:HD-GYP domain-containing protein n=1 Tax=Cyanobium sp. Morenito 9A2 TaxID=2823718 RepID=UPI0020CF9F0F|nr:HD domain-containing phosphohydrolase [Cyanobium sp. Morenito 9A2]MCP9850125.1 HD domain-containing protein [Cyanobium sp. Morenito 9A2]
MEPLLKPLSEQPLPELVVFKGTLRALLAVLEARDTLTFVHSHRMADLAAAIAVELGLTSEAVACIRIGGLLHDIGMIAMPIDIVSKPSQLSIAELAAITGHPVTGYAVLRNIPLPLPMNLAVLQHHERLDGTGYPDELKGEAICQAARILAVADTVESMVSERPYRAALGLEAALGVIISGKGVKFDPKVVEACVRLFRLQDYRLPESFPSYLQPEGNTVGDLLVGARDLAEPQLF